MKRYILILSAASLLAAGCNKKLDQVNPNAQTSSSFWKTGADAVQGVNAAYAPMLLDGAYMRFTPILLDVRGDDIRSNSPWTAISGVGKFALGTSDASGYGWAFDEYYEGVARCNQVLDNVPGISMDADLKNRVLGQAYFLRGLYFFHLVNMFGNVALPITTPKSSSDFFSPQTTEAQGWKQVIADFKAAVDLLPATYTNVSGADANQLGRATKGAAMGYLGKAYLFNKMYTEAAAQFKGVIDLGVYDLMPDYKDNFTESKENNIESVFEIQFSTTVGGTDLGWQGIPTSTWAKTSARAITFGAPNFGWTDVQPSLSAFNEFQQEKTIDGQVDPRLDATMFYNKPGETIYGQSFALVYANSSYLNDVFCRKYENGDGNKANEYDWKSGINERLMRYSDILLMYAESLNELNQTSQAAPYIQKVRTRANLPDITATLAAMTQQQMRDQLAHERLLEFCLEGHRFDDIRRWGWLQDATKLDMLKARDPEFNNYKAGKELYPIPQGEIDNNPGFKQNSSY
ncbi:Starch-binding associating with outer membrane [Chitinophaga sp. CF118]|uniref:RagB/SusD family nutrient uptake outer membrane protein n=1 Tax=Chitinophaga sp. CF118 TaxID=1884367 RepID=UPI0008EFB373|nr:RagB/SusD family nutrient uptake outer membrane protein [Chitinophaga sp. CF118]SFD87719.1 Starch-binding associating with outer membrane [Chitinophaga sp. CF118]